MLNKIKNRKQEGFTIIEVLIVLAIAGLILLIVFLAVPALQRNSRNTQRKNDVAAILGGITEYSNNNGGAIPTDYGAFSANVKTGFYTADDISLDSADADTANGTNEGTVAVYTGVKCEVDADGVQTGNAVTSGASARNSVALYTVETSGDGQKICQEN